MKFLGTSLNRSREISSEVVGGDIVGRRFRYNFRPEVDSDVVSGAAVDNVGPVKLGDSRSNGFRDIRGADFVSNERTNIKIK